jgi:DivIVA domain-containing protein
VSALASETESLTGVGVGTRRFATARRGYDTEEVDEFLIRVADRIRELEGEVHRQQATLDLLQRKVASAQEAAYARVFRQLMEVMRTAEREAARIRADAQREAAAVLTKAREQATLAASPPPRAGGSRRKAGVATKEQAAPEADDFAIDIEMLWGDQPAT